MVEKMSGSLGGSNRAASAIIKRGEAIAGWSNSATGKQPSVRHPEQFTIKFDKGTVFLSAVASGDLDEVESLLKEGVDIDYTNVDGLTALHQACIDENEEMVTLLLEEGANIEARDNEGWTPLHAAVSAGNVDIAKILIDEDADLLAVNNEGEVPLDLAEEDEMDEYISEVMDEKGIDPDEARNEEEETMLADARSWLTKKHIDQEPLDWQGATALHVAAAKGYDKVISTLLQINSVDVNVRDNDGWTPLHAAIHWGAKDVCETLAGAGASFDVRNNNGQTPCDVADPDFVKFAENLRKQYGKKSSSGDSEKKSDLNCKPELNIKQMLEKQPEFSILSGKKGAKNKENEKSETKPNKPERKPEPEPETKPQNKRITQGNTPTFNITTTKKEPTSISSRTSIGTSKFNINANISNKPTVSMNSTTKTNIITNSTGRSNISPNTARTSSTSSFADRKRDSQSYGVTSTSSKVTNSLDDRKCEIDSRVQPTPNKQSNADEAETNENEPPSTGRHSSNTDSNTGRMSIADRLRIKNQELLASSDNTRHVPYTTSRDSTSSTSLSTSSYSSRSNRTFSSTTDTGDTASLQRKLDQAQKEAEEYKQKYEKMKKEKEDLEKKLEQYKEDIDKMQELKNDNIRLKDENGALIRVISKLSRTPSSS